ncbi:hypothetical protein [Granulicella arctica]|uniref:hypothetical protein n=1 Tax=Granulicella arctica TaxID=940613 RepID=UPI0021DF8EAC|nr:hypothetical protein [Granulicella arctica]
MFKKIQVGIICLAVACFIGAVVSYAGLPTIVAASLSLTVTTILWNFLLSHRSTTKVPEAERNQQLALAPPAGFGLVYVSRELKLAGGAIGFDVELDSQSVTQLKAGRFTRVVVAPGTHLLKAGPQKAFGQTALPDKGEITFTLSAGETAVFTFGIKRSMMKSAVEVIREPDVQLALAKLATCTMVAPDKPAEAAQVSSSLGYGAR